MSHTNINGKRLVKQTPVEACKSVKQLLNLLFFLLSYRLIVYNATHLIVDTGELFDTTYRGGRLGVYGFSQGKVTYSNLETRCNGM